jgi:parvulin-like peptidyl-prolyl isomerase
MAIVVNGQRIEQSEIDAEVEALQPHYEQYVQGQGEPGQLEQWAKENLVERAIVQQAARAIDVEIPAGQIDEVYQRVREQAGEAPPEQVKADIDLQMRVDRLMSQGVQDVPEPAEEDLRAAYQEHADQFVTPELVHASHIVKHVDGRTDKKTAYEAILSIQMELAEGKSFEELANRVSDCPGQGGDLGWFPRGQMVEEFENVVFNMKPGEVSDIFLSQFGYHIAKVLERRESQPVPFEQVRDHLATELTRQRQGEAVDDFVDKLKESATIEEVE